MSEAPDLMTAEEVASVLRVKPPTVYRWAKAGTIPSVTIGGARRFRRADIAALIAAPPSDGEAA